MAPWLLSGHNPRETFGISYPITVSYSTEFGARRQLGYFVSTLAGGTKELDTTIPAMLPVQGYLYLNMQYFVRNVGLILPFDVAVFGAPQGLVVSNYRSRLKTRLLLPLRIRRIYLDTVHTYRVVVPKYREALGELYWRLRVCDSKYLAEHGLALLDRLFEPTMLEDISAFCNAYVVVTLLNAAIAEVVNRRAPALLNLLVGYRTSTAQLADRMWALRQITEESGPEVVQLLHQGETNPNVYRNTPAAAPLLRAMEAFMRTYGHRAFRYASEFEATRLADQSELLLLTLAALLEENEPPAVRAEAARQLGRRALEKMNPVRRFFWRSLLRWGSVLVERREENRDTLELQNATYGLAARLLSRYYFPDQPDDYLWLYTFDEFLAFGQSHGQERVDPELIERRRAELERNRRLPVPAELIWYDPGTQQWWPVQEEQAPTSTVRLQGIGVSAGSGPVEGIALVTDSAQEAAERLLKITGPLVLVAHVTDPVWSSLFRRLVAVVTEMGGAISHAAIVARESGIPAVVGIPEATHKICDGQWVRVDGAAGVVEVITSPFPRDAI